MNKEEKVRTMTQNYAARLAALPEHELMEFHREHLISFLERFGGLIVHFPTPSSHYLDTELFWVVEVATQAAEADLAELKKHCKEIDPRLEHYFVLFSDLRCCTGDMKSAVLDCLVALGAKPGESI
jgi:hypothetical protein